MVIDKNKNDICSHFHFLKRSLFNAYKLNIISFILPYIRKKQYANHILSIGVNGELSNITFYFINSAVLLVVLNKIIMVSSAVNQPCNVYKMSF